MSTNRPFLWNVDIFGPVGYSELGAHSQTLTVCSGVWKYIDTAFDGCTISSGIRTNMHREMDYGWESK